MTAKTYLSQLTDIDIRILSLQNLIKKCHEDAEKITPVYADAPPQFNGNVSSKVADNIERISEYESEIQEMIKQKDSLRITIIREIDRIPNNMLSTLLTNKYANGMTWGQITESIGKTDEDHVRKFLHSKALEEFEKIHPF